MAHALLEEQPDGPLSPGAGAMRWVGKREWKVGALVLSVAVGGGSADAKPWHGPGERTIGAPEIATQGRLELRGGERGSCNSTGMVCVRAVVGVTRLVP